MRQILMIGTLTASLMGAGLAASLAGGEANAQSRPEGRPAHICTSDATPIYSCHFGTRTVSVCEQGGILNYNFGRSARQPEITVVGGDDNRNVHFGSVIGQGGGSEQHLRFTNNGTHYVVYSGTNGNLADRPGRTYSGLNVWRGRRLVSSRQCDRPTVGQNGAAFPPNANIGIPREPVGGPFDGWM
jgi:hypothetical protein